jgi:hypothetical protein
MPGRQIRGCQGSGRAHRRSCKQGPMSTAAAGAGPAASSDQPSITTDGSPRSGDGGRGEGGPVPANATLRARAPSREKNFVTDGVTNSLHCTRCRRQLPADAFRLVPRNTRRGRSSWCKACSLDRTQEWRAENRDEINARRRARHSLNPEFERRKARERYRARQDARRPPSDLSGS